MNCCFLADADVLTDERGSSLGTNRVGRVTEFSLELAKGESAAEEAAMPPSKGDCEYIWTGEGVAVCTWIDGICS